VAEDLDMLRQGTIATGGMIMPSGKTKRIKGPFGALYVSTFTRSPQRLVSERTFATSGQHATDTMMCSCGASSESLIRGRLQAAGEI
jgi:hypothetical protein